MGKITARHRDSLNQLVLDCSLYNFNEKEALEYIKTRFGKTISGRTYRRYKSNLENGNISQQWLNNFTRVGYVITQHQVFEGARYLLESSMRRLHEIEKFKSPRDENYILKLKQEIREELYIVSEFSLGNPIISNLKKQGDKYYELVKNLRMRDPELCWNLTHPPYNPRGN